MFHDLFTPRTIRHYTGHLGGAVYGSPRKRRDESGLGIAIASHPADAERIRFFEEAARR